MSRAYSADRRIASPASLRLFNVASGVALLIGICLAASPGAARRIAIDDGNFFETAGCSLTDTVCQPLTLPFAVDFGSGLTTSAFLYDEGFITLGSPFNEPAANRIFVSSEEFFDVDRASFHDGAGGFEFTSFNTGPFQLSEARSEINFFDLSALGTVGDFRLEIVCPQFCARIFFELAGSSFEFENPDPFGLEVHRFDFTFRNEAAPVPEPSALALLGLGSMALLAAARRSRAHPSS